MTFTKEQLVKIIESADEVISACDGTNEDVHPESDDMLRLSDHLNDVAAPPEVVRRLAEIALAALESRADAEPAREFLPKNLDRALGVVGVALPESREEFNLQSERWIQRLIDRVIRYADEFKEQPAPVVPGSKVITPHFDTLALDTAREIMCDINRRGELLGGDVQLLSRIQCRIDNACRAAMLQGKAEPVSQPYTLPECFDRLFKHAQGLTFGDDWNRGTAAKYHRDSLIKAVDDCRAMLAAAPQQEAESE